MKYIKNINIDFSKQIYTPILAKQSDTARYVLFRLLDNGIAFDLTNKTVRAYCIKPDGKKVFNDLVVVDFTEGLAELKLTTQILALEGNVEIELTVYEGTDILTTLTLSMKVVKTIRNDAAIESTNEYSALTLALATVNKYDNRITALETGKFDKTGGNISGNVNCGVLSANGINNMKGYFQVYPYSSEYVEETNQSWLQMWYDAKQNRVQTYRRYLGGATDTSNYLNWKNGNENFVTDGHAYTWTSQQIFNDNIAVAKILKMSNYLTMFDHGKASFTGSVAQMYFNAANKMVKFQNRDSETGAVTNDLKMFINNDKVVVDKDIAKFEDNTFCQVTLSANSAGATGWGIVPLNSVVVDTKNEFNSTKKAIVIKETGYYMVSAMVTFYKLTQNEMVVVGISSTVADDSVAFFRGLAGIDQQCTFSGCTILKLTAGEEIQLNKFQNTASNILSGVKNTCLTIKRIY